MLLFIVLALVDIGSSYTEKKCYGSYYDVPFKFTPPVFKDSIYYQPRDEEQKLVVSDGQSRHIRFAVSYGKIRMKDLTEQDDEGVLMFGGIDSVKLDIKDCQEVQSSNYGSVFSLRIPTGAEYMEFAKLSSGFALKPEVVWNRTNPSAGRGTVKRYHLELYNLRQKDSGYYKFMGAKGELIKWKRLNVKEYFRDFEQVEGDNLELDFPVMFSELHQILFTPRASAEHERIYYRQSLSYRMELTDWYFSFFDLTEKDSGTYRFIDDDGFLALQMELEVAYPELPTWVYIVSVIVFVLCIIFCCCCVKKCCCKKSSNKRNSPEATGPHVFYHDTTQSTQPVILIEREPRVIASDPPTFNSAHGNMDLPTSTQATVPERFELTSTSLISTDSDPKFEFKGTIFPSAPPLNSGTSIQDVYTSDKLNFF